VLSNQGPHLDVGAKSHLAADTFQRYSTINDTKHRQIVREPAFYASLSSTRRHRMIEDISGPGRN